MRLRQFIDDARNRVACGAYDTMHDLPSNGSLAAALQRPDAIIAELKPRSPSEGRILNRSPAALLEDYHRGGAAALSILTDSDHFDGSLDLLVAAHATGLPTLMKDFIVDTRQLDAAKVCGASAVLLIERCFAEQAQREALVEAAHDRGLEVLLEIHGDEAPRIADSAADIIGVNARNLDTLDVDVQASLEVIGQLANKPVVALSGIQGPADVQAARRAGAAACLVGTMLVRHPDPATALRALRRPLAKVCGIRDAQGLEAAIAAGADMVGFVVGAPDSPRNIGSLQAQQLADVARDAGLATVLVTPHMDDWEVREWCRVVKPTWLQLHGLKPSEEWAHSLRAIPTHIIQALGPDAPIPHADGVLLDSAAPGSGTTHDWKHAKDRMPRGFSLIAGGLGPNNAADAVAATGAWGADASSGLESTPGVKDAALVHAYVAALHGDMQ